MLPVANTRPDGRRSARAADGLHRVRLSARWLHRRHRPLGRGIAGGSDLSAADARPAACNQTTLVVSAADNAAAGVSEIKIKGTASINGQPVVREARAGGIVWPLAQPQQPMPDDQPARSRPVPGRARQGRRSSSPPPRQAALHSRRQGNHDRQADPPVAGLQSSPSTVQAIDGAAATC